MEVKTKPDIRFLNDMKKVLADQVWAEKAPNFELYYMYRGVDKKDGLRYDLTIIPPRMLGKEFVKTQGHGHSDAFGEVYTVLRGKAIFLVQKYTEGKIEDVYAIEAKKGESAVVPPHYSHVTINPSKTKTLEEANWISEKCQNLYEEFLQKQGACYYFTEGGWIKNEEYGIVPKLRFEKALKSLPENLDFLHGK